MKILMVADYTYRIPSGNATLHKGKIYEAYSYRDSHYKVKVEDREDDVLVPENIVREVANGKPITPLQEHVKKILDGEAPIETLQHVSRPESEHYHTGGVDVWQFADENFNSDEVLGFHRINIIKYVTRYGKKNGYNRIDLEKARVMIDKLLELHDKER